MTGRLDGKRIVNTRAAHQAEALDDLLRERGAVPLDYPCIAIIPPDDCCALDVALADLTAGHFDWLVLTSANTVHALAQRLAVSGMALAGNFRTAAVGPATAQAAREWLNLTAVDLPEEYIAESLAASLPVEAGTRVLLPESAIAPPTLATLLTERGAAVTVTAAYQTVRGGGGVNIPRLLAERSIDALTFTSSSTVTYFLERLMDEGGRIMDALALPAVCIGPKTARTAYDCGFMALHTASEYTLEGLLETLDALFIQ
ncbi:MAG: uroporphyrinogen-III synthase [Anaerolineae bacterium]|nr:uroporphyrinogen-III synthase [Anaerolineae bacterium]